MGRIIFRIYVTSVCSFKFKLVFFSTLYSYMCSMNKDIKRTKPFVERRDPFNKDECLSFYQNSKFDII